MSLYYYADGDQQRGPVAAGELAARGVSGETLVWREGMADWARADAVPELVEFFAASGEVAKPRAADGGASQEPPPLAEAPAPVPMTAVAHPQPWTAPVTPQARELGYHSAYGPGAPSNGTAIASMIVGIVAAAGLVVGCMWYVSIPCAIIAIVLGYQAKARIARGEATGRGYALTGIITGIVTLALVALGIIALLVILGIALAAG